MATGGCSGHSGKYHNPMEGLDKLHVERAKQALTYGTSDTESETSEKKGIVSEDDIVAIKDSQQGYDPRTGPRWNDSFIGQTYLVNVRNEPRARLDGTWLGHGPVMDKNVGYRHKVIHTYTEDEEAKKPKFELVERI